MRISIHEWCILHVYYKLHHPIFIYINIIINKYKFVYVYTLVDVCVCEAVNLCECVSVYAFVITHRSQYCQQRLHRSSGWSVCVCVCVKRFVKKIHCNEKNKTKQSKQKLKQNDQISFIVAIILCISQWMYTFFFIYV